VLHHGTLLFGLVDGVAETLVEDRLHRNLAVLERLKPDTDFMPTDCSMLGTAALAAAQKRRATESCRRMLNYRMRCRGGLMVLDDGSTAKGCAAGIGAT
jgi:hypothetical protein